MNAKVKDAAPVEAPPIVETIVDAVPLIFPGDPMGDAPRDGRWIEVSEDGETWTPVRFYQTRMRLPGSVAWAPVSCWSTSEPPRYANRVKNPVAWRRPAEVTFA